MKPQYATEQLIETIKMACSVPTSQLTYTNDDWAQLATYMLQNQVVPLIMSTREEFFVTYEDVLTPADGIIPLPEGAIGSKLRNVSYVSQTSPLVLVNLPRLDLDVVAGVGFFNVMTFAGFYVQGDNIILYPNTSVPTNTTIRLYYYRRALTLAPPDSYGRVQSVDTMTNTIVLDNVPTDWIVGDELNTIGSQPNFLITNSDCVISALSSPSITLDTVDGIAVGDYVTQLGYSAIPQVPLEAHNYLAQLTAAKALEGLGDQGGAKTAYEVAEQIKTSLLVMVSNRVDGSPKKVVNPSGGLRVNAGIRRRGYGW